MVLTNAALGVYMGFNGINSMLNANNTVDFLSGLTEVFMAGHSFRSAMQSCFSGDTKLMTPNGLQRIDSFVPGDMILSRDEHDVNGPVEAKMVEEVFKRYAQVLEITVNGQTIRTTGEHPFYVVARVEIEGKYVEERLGIDREEGYDDGYGNVSDNGGLSSNTAVIERSQKKASSDPSSVSCHEWLPANQIRSGDVLIGHDGKMSVVEGIRDTKFWEPVYNLRIADWHTYFVGGERGLSLWTHNSYQQDIELIERYSQFGENLSPSELAGVANAMKRVEARNQLVEQVRSDAKEQINGVDVSNRNGQLVAVSRAAFIGEDGSVVMSSRFNNMQANPNKFPGVRFDKNRIYVDNPESFINQIEDLYKQSGNPLNPIIKQRILDHIAENGGSGFTGRDQIPGLHAEVQAVNSLLNTVGNVDFSRIGVATFRLTEKYGQAGNPFQACNNCGPILRGTQILTGVTLPRF
jgi:hypothetical protein